MARFSRVEVINEILRIGVVPVFYNPDLETAQSIIEACAAAGLRVIEFTNRGDNAYRVFSDLVLHFARVNPSLILGVGSGIDPATGALYVSSGANFVVGSALNPELARMCNRRKVSYSPGCGSASEISQAEELGVEIVKIFPGDSVGPQVCQVDPGSDSLDAHYAHRRRGRQLREHRGLVQSWCGCSRHRLQSGARGMGQSW